MSFQFPVTFDQEILRQYREELQWANQEIEMLAIALERQPDDMSNVDQLRTIVQESLLSAEKLDLVPIKESLSDVLKGIDLLLDWQYYPVRMTEFVLSLFDRVMDIAKEVEERSFIDMRKTQAILVALQSIILAKNEEQMLFGLEDAIVAINKETSNEPEQSAQTDDIELFGDDDGIELFGDDDDASQVDIFIPEMSRNPLILARDYIDNNLNDQCMLVLDHIADCDVQHTYAHTRFILELALAVNFSAGEPVSNEDVLKGICLHDIALASLPHLLGKKQYTQEEIEELKMHPLHSAEIARLLCDSKAAENLILHHHEYIDGSGYPFGLKGDAISEEGKLAAIVDRFHEIMEKNPGLDAKKRVLRGIYEVNVHSGKRFDAAWVEEFNKTLKDYWLPDWNDANIKIA